MVGSADTGGLERPRKRKQARRRSHQRARKKSVHIGNHAATEPPSFAGDMEGKRGVRVSCRRGGGGEGEEETPRQ